MEEWIIQLMQSMGCLLYTSDHCYQRIMIHADFVKTGDLLTGFCLTGHAGYDDYGHDIVCASVTSAVQMAANGITEVLKLGAQVDVGENEIKMTLDRADAKKGHCLLYTSRCV